MPVTLAQTAVSYSTLYNASPTTSAATLFTSSSGDGIHSILAVNGTGSAATITLTVVRKGSTSTAGDAVTIASAVSVAANSTAELIPSENLHSAYSELLLQTGDALYGLQGTSSAITLLVIGS